MVIGFLRAGGRKKVHKLRQFDSEFTSNTFTHREGITGDNSAPLLMIKNH